MLLELNQYLFLIGVVFCGLGVFLWVVLSIREGRKKTRSFEEPPTVVGDATSNAAVASRAEKIIHSDREDPNVLGWKQQDRGETYNQEYVLGRGKTILIADDDPVVSLALSKRLERLGYQVLRMTDATHALFGIKKVQPDLAILDLEMPSGNGLAVCEMLACDRQCAGIPIIVHSVSADDSIKRRCQQLKVHFVQKSPHSWKEIKEWVDVLLEKKLVPPESLAELERAETPSGPETPSEESMVPLAEAREPEIAKTGARMATEPLSTEEKTRIEDVGDYLAAVQPKKNEEELAAQAVAPWEHKSLVVLCIDDDPVIIRSIAVRLQPYGIKVRGVNNGTEGYLSAVADPPSMILLDLKMPNGQGDYVLSKLKDNPYTRDIPVIVLTIESTAGVQRKMTSLGAESLVTKPVHWPELFSRMGKCIQLPEQLLIDYKLPEQLTVQEA
jgi:CheY-like chemotaxis protein